MRENGFYLVKYWEKLIIAEWFNDTWWIPGREEYFNDTYFNKIYESKLDLADLEKEKEQDDELNNDIEILYALLDTIQEKHGRPKEDITDVISCPKCKTGTITYSVSKINGHSRGKCSTDGCMEWFV